LHKNTATINFANNTPSGYIKCNAVAGATGYLVKFYPVGSMVVYAQKNSSSTNITFAGLTPALQMGTQYDVTVTPLFVGGGVGIESTKCRMGLMRLPTPNNIAATMLKSPTCKSTAISAAAVVPASTIIFTTVSQASSYEFKFVNQADNSAITAYASYVNQRTLAPLNLVAGATYAVSVRAKVLGIWAANFGTLCYIKISSGSKEESSNENIVEVFVETANIKLFQNPAKTNITFESNTSNQISIYTILGEEIFNSKMQSKTIIDISNFAKGIYFVRSNDGAISKFVKE